MSTKENDKKGTNNKDSQIIALRVQEAKKRDIGRNIARIDQETMEKLNIQTGDVIALSGKKESAGIAWPSYPQDSGLGIIRIDSRLKKNTGASIDETIQIRKVNAHPSQNIVLAPISVKIKSNPRFETFVKRKLNNYPVTIEIIILLRSMILYLSQ
jgi:transitional endoplasmic reticulum ATPase